MKKTTKRNLKITAVLSVLAIITIMGLITKSITEIADLGTITQTKTVKQIVFTEGHIKNADPVVIETDDETIVTDRYETRIKRDDTIEHLTVITYKNSWGIIRHQLLVPPNDEEWLNNQYKSAYNEDAPFQ